MSPFLRGLASSNLNLIGNARPTRQGCVEEFQRSALKFIGGDNGIRTHDPLLAGQVLSQLSYTPMYESVSRVPGSPSKIEQRNCTKNSS